MTICSCMRRSEEDLGTGGRGGYFDGFGIIRDIMQNHLLQVFLWLAMEAPASLSRESVAQEKCRLLRAVRALEMRDCVGCVLGGASARRLEEVRQFGAKCQIMFPCRAARGGDCKRREIPGGTGYTISHRDKCCICSSG